MPHIQSDMLKTYSSLMLPNFRVFMAQAGSMASVSGILAFVKARQINESFSDLTESFRLIFVNVSITATQGIIRYPLYEIFKTLSVNDVTA